MPGEDEVSLIEIKKLAKRIATRLGTTSPADSALFKMLENEPDRSPLTVESYTKIVMYWGLVTALLDKLEE